MFRAFGCALVALTSSIHVWSQESLCAQIGSTLAAGLRPVRVQQATVLLLKRIE